MHCTVSLIFDCKLKSDLLNYVYPFLPVISKEALIQLFVRQIAQIKKNCVGYVEILVSFESIKPRKMIEFFAWYLYFYFKLVLKERTLF